MAALLASRLDPETTLVLKGNKPLEMRFHKRHRAILYASDPAYLDAVLDEERGWHELPIPAMSLMVFRHRDLTDFLEEPFEFVAQARRRKKTAARWRSSMTGKAQSTEPSEPPKENTLDLLRLFYDTLKRGYWNHDPFCEGVLEGGAGSGTAVRRAGVPSA